MINNAKFSIPIALYVQTKIFSYAKNANKVTLKFWIFVKNKLFLMSVNFMNNIIMVNVLKMKI